MRYNRGCRTYRLLLLVGIFGALPAFADHQPPTKSVTATTTKTTIIQTTTDDDALSTVEGQTATYTTATTVSAIDYIDSSVTFTQSTAAITNLTVVQLLCWTQPDECSVAAEFHRIELGFRFPANIDCAAAHPDSGSATHRPWPVQYSNISAISLNGCSVGSRRGTTLGAEFVPDPGAARWLQLRMFRVVGAVRADSFAAFVGLQELQILDNIVDSVAEQSLGSLQALRVLHLSNNNLSALADRAIADLHRLENFTLHEPELRLQAEFVLPVIMRYFNLQIKQLMWLRDWPVEMEWLCIRATSLNYTNEALANTLHSMPHLRTISIEFCNITTWPTFRHDSLRHLNLSNNHLTGLNDLQLTSLESLDISHNHITELGDAILRPLRNLFSLNAESNRLRWISNNAFSRNARLDHVLLADNQLRQIAPNLAQQQTVRLHIDRNPWSCKWALDISDTHPQIFAHFRYAKVLDNVNMRGLRCEFYEAGVPINAADERPANGDWDVSNAGNRTANGTTTTTMLRRHPKDTAMLTLIILVVGVTFLFLLLFLHIRCRRAAMQPFYRTLPYDQQQQQQQQPAQLSQQRRPQQPLQQQMAERTDYVRRELPATDYEAPIVCRIGGRGRLRSPGEGAADQPQRKEVAGAATDGRRAMPMPVPDEDDGLLTASRTDLTNRVYEEIRECKAAARRADGKVHASAMGPTKEVKQSKSRSNNGADGGGSSANNSNKTMPKPKQKFASMNNMLYDKSGNGNL